MGGFHVHRSNRLERLVGALGELLADTVGTPLEPEAVVVQGRGMEIWLGGELAKRFGVWATRMRYPRELVEGLVSEVLGAEALGEPPVSEDLLAWTVQAVLPGLLGQKEFAALARYASGDERGTKTAQLAGRIATVFDQYLTYRPEWLRAWEQGDLSAIPESDHWQALLWKRVAERLERPHLGVAVERLIARLGEGERPEGLPPRVLAFGLSTLPPLYVRALVALSRHVEVHLFLFSASPALWPPKLRKPTRPGARLELDLESSLLASLGPLGADFDLVLQAALSEAGIAGEQHDLHETPKAGPLLTALQADLYSLAGSGAPKLRVAPDDSTLSVHSCHGPMREVEVLHHQLLDLVTRNEGRVRPEEVVVLVPDLPTYAPLIEAVFARDMGQDDFIPYHVADRSERQSSPVLDGLLRVMEMVRGRLTASDVFDLLVLEPVAGRMELDAASIETLRGWVAASGVRWGIDGAHREALGLPADEGNTWRFGLRRLLLGYALPGDGEHLFEGVLPFDEVEGKDAELLGTLAWFVRTLFRWLKELERPRPLADWVGTLVELTEGLFAEDRDTARQLARAIRVLEGAVEDARAAGFEGDVDVQVLHDLLEQAADMAGADHGFLSGGVTFCAMVPMRSIPFKVVGLLGMNDGDFPRSPRPIEFDLVRNGKLSRQPGDRSRRDDDRHLFLETLCAARERLIVTYTGQSVRDDRARPPSVCVSELLDHLGDRCALPAAEQGEGGEALDPRERARKHFVVKHPLQGFSPRYFDGNDARLFSYSTPYAEAAANLGKLRQTDELFIGEALEAAELTEVRLDELVKFFKSPPAYFLNRRLGLYLRQEDGGMSDREPLELDNLDDWKLGTALLEHLLADRPRDESEELLRAAGELPLGHSGTLKLEQLVGVCEDIADETRKHRSGAPLEPLLVDVGLPSGVRVTGTVAGRWEGGVVKSMYSTVAGKYLLEAWLHHVALCSMDGAGARSVLIGRDKGKAKATAWPALELEAARGVLEELVALYRQGLELPLPFLPQTSLKYFEKATSGELEEGLKNALKAYDDDDRGERAFDPHPARAFNETLPPFDSEYDAGKRPLDETEFHRVALAVFGPLRAAEGDGASGPKASGQTASAKGKASGGSGKAAAGKRQSKAKPRGKGS